MKRIFEMCIRDRIKASPFEAVYPQTEGLTSNAIAKCVRQLLPLSLIHI